MSEIDRNMYKWYWETNIPYVKIPKKYGEIKSFHKTADEKKLFLICDNGVLELKYHLKLTNEKKVI